MIKHITCTLIFLFLLHLTYAQGNSYSQISQKSSRSKFIDRNTMYGKNFYFEQNWVKGKLLMADNTVISSDTIFYNYEKVNHRLLFTTDLINIFELDSREYKAVLFYFKDTGYVFKHIYNVNEKDLFQVLVNEKNKYSLFKIPCSKLVRTYVGGESYYPYGAIKFLEIPAYYLFFPGQDYKTLFVLKKQAVEKMFALTPELTRVEEYLNNTGKKDMDEKDLIHLVQYLNQ